MGLPDLYPAQVGSPYTTLATPYTAGGATMTVVDATKLPDAPNIVCLAGAVAGEFVYTGKDGNVLQGVAALPGTPAATWTAGTFAFRGIAAYDTNALQQSVNMLQQNHLTMAVPDLPNRVVYETDGAESTIEIHQVYLPKFMTAGLPWPNLNGILCGETWYDKYLACQPDATNASYGSTVLNNPGDVGAASKPHVVPWVGIDWDNAKKAVENRGGVNNRKAGDCTALDTTSASAFYVEDVSHLIGKRVYIVQDAIRYVRRIIKTGGDPADPNVSKRVEIYPALPEPITEADSYEILHYYLPGGKERFDLWAWAHMHLYQNGLSWPKGNTDWGKSHSDSRTAVNEGIPDLLCTWNEGNAISRTLTGSGPLTWTLNGKESGIWDIVGNCWEYVDLVFGTNADYTIDPEYPGAGFVLSGPGGRVAALYDPTPDGVNSVGAETFVPKEIGEFSADLGNIEMYINPGQRIARWGGGCDLRAGISLATMYFSHTIATAHQINGFRGVC